MSAKNRADVLGITPKEILSKAIIVQAAEDYQRMRKILDLNPCNKAAQKERKNIEAFFRSETFAALTRLNPEQLINRLNEEYEENRRSA